MNNPTILFRIRAVTIPVVVLRKSQKVFDRLPLNSITTTEQAFLGRASSFYFFSFPLGTQNPFVHNKIDLVFFLTSKNLCEAEREKKEFGFCPRNPHYDAVISKWICNSFPSCVMSFTEGHST
ncbi:hypothetical protein CDAR_319941 [Caerostris darwini]|uniref:Uncharacterized protein n=1 Tax=Caerostris darwini TaxID=1538125 RepID=A0AAV4M7Z1_9ARAC|nr:hypothetical protein CDAR_319941 [Caerostris darwini]